MPTFAFGPTDLDAVVDDTCTHGAVYIGELATRLGVEAGTVTDILEQMVQLGLLAHINGNSRSIDYHVVYSAPTPDERRLAHTIAAKTWQSTPDPFADARRMFADICAYLVHGDDGTDRYPDINFLAEDIQARLNTLIRQDSNL